VDVYMPGYSGLEVCEKVRANIATIKTPVLLTVGKMEPYKPEDANRVRADGVIIKPFEASDLLAIIKKFEERIKSMPAPAVMATPAPARKTVDLYPEPEHPEPARARVMQPMVEVPDHMASSSAFSDLLGGDSSHAMPHFAAPSAAVPQENETTKLSAVPENDVPLSWKQDAEPQPSVIAVPAPDETAALEALSEPEAEATPEANGLPVTEAAVDAPPSPEIVGSTMLRPVQIPVYQDSEPSDFIPTASAPTGDIDVAREPELQESAEEITRSTVADAREAGLVPTSHAIHDATSAAPVHAALHANVTEMTVEAPADLGSANPAVEPAMIESQSPEMAVEASGRETHEAQEPSAAAPAPILSPTLTNDDFEARVAAAMAAYSHAQPASPAQSGASVNKNGLSEMPASAAASASAPAIEELAVTTPVIHATQAADIQAADIEHVPEEASSAPAHIQAEAHSEVAASATTEAVTARVEAELPAAISAVAEAAEASVGEHHHIAQVVHRVMERMKGDLVEEIVRELKSRK
jgi:CheY-like chemotaxis protein